VKRNKNLARYFAVAAGIAALCGTSAFAETRHHDGTRSDDGNRGSHVERSDRSGSSNHERSGSQPSSNWNRDRVNTERSGSNWNRDRVNTERSGSNWNRDRVNTERKGSNWNRDNRDNRNFDRNRGESNGYRDHGRVESYRSGSSYNRGGRSGYFYRGRLERYEPWHGGFRIWLGGAPYPFWVPEAYFRSHGFRVGISIGLGGFYNPLGYYDYDPYYYDGPYYNDGYYGSTVTSGDIRGVVESVDWRRGTLVIRDDVSGNFVTAQMRGRDRMLDSLRQGDYVDLQGDWVRGGIFEAYRADLIDGRDGSRY